MRLVEGIDLGRQQIGRGRRKVIDCRIQAGNAIKPHHRRVFEPFLGRVDAAGRCLERGVGQRLAGLETVERVHRQTQRIVGRQILVDVRLGPAEHAIRVVATYRHALEAPLTIVGLQAQAVAELVVEVAVAILDGELRRDDVVLGVRVAEDRRLELGDVGVGQDLVGDLITRTDRQLRNALVGVLFLRVVEYRVAAQVQAVGHVEHAEEQRLSPCNLLVADAQVQRAAVVVEEQRRQIDQIVFAGDFKWVSVALAFGPELEVVRAVAAIQLAVATGDAAAIKVNAVGIEVVIARIVDRAHAADQRQVVAQSDTGFKLTAQNVVVRPVVRRLDTGALRGVGQ